MHRHLTALLACAALVGLAGCGSDDATPTEQPDAPTVTQPVADQGSDDMDPTTPDTDPTSEPASDRVTEPDADDSSDLATTLAGRTFLSMNVEGHALVGGTQIRLSFQVDTVGAAAGCNALGYNTTYDNGTLIVSDGMQTEEGCSDELEAQDAWLGSFVRSRPRLAIEDDTLTLA